MLERMGVVSIARATQAQAGPPYRLLPRLRQQAAIAGDDTLLRSRPSPAQGQRGQLKTSCQQGCRVGARLTSCAPIALIFFSSREESHTSSHHSKPQGKRAGWDKKRKRVIDVWIIWMDGIDADSGHCLDHFR